MPITGQNIVDKVASVLQDVAHVRWLADELLGIINSGLKELIILKPNANPVTANVQCTTGTKQTLPAGGIQFGKVTRNMGANGSTPGSAIIGKKMELLDKMLPNWHSAAAATASKYFCFDPKFPKTYYLYPPQTGYVELSYFAVPTELASLSATIFDDLYESVLIDYVLYRAYLKDGQLQQSGYHYKAFLNALGGKTSGEKGAAPNSQPDQPQE
jgi:hypothetical protein